MSAMNSVNVTGRLAKDPESDSTKGGTDVCKFRLAIDGAGNAKDEAGFVNIVVYGPSAPPCQEYLSKGSLVGITGQLRVSSWKDDDDNYRERIEITTVKVDFLDTKSKTSSGESEDSAEAEPVTAGTSEDPEF